MAAGKLPPMLRLWRLVSRFDIRDVMSRAWPRVEPLGDDDWDD